MAKKINLAEQEGQEALKAIVDKRIERILEAESLGYPQDVKMNSHDGVGTSGAASKKTPTDDPTNVKMNANDKNVGNVDSAAVEVKASGTMGTKDVHAGQNKVSLKTKEAEGYVEPEMSTEEKQTYVKSLEEKGKVKKVSSEKFINEAGKISLNGLHVEDIIDKNERYLYIRTGKLKGPNEKWYKIEKSYWSKVSEEDPFPEVKLDRTKFLDLDLPPDDITSWD